MSDVLRRWWNPASLADIQLGDFLASRSPDLFPLLAPTQTSLAPFPSLFRLGLLAVDG